MNADCEVKLLSCPFCGGPAKYVSHYWFDGNSAGNYVICTQCTARNQRKRLVTDLDPIAAWNTRLSTRATDEVGWQPIETAPRDGTYIDLWVEDGDTVERFTDAYFGRPQHTCGEAGPYCDCCPTRDGWVDSTFNCYIGGEDGVGDEPTHWRPLPAAPVQERTGG